MSKFRTFHVTSLGFSREAVKRMLLEARDLAIQLRPLLLKPRSVVASNLSTFERSVLSSESRNLVLLSFVRFGPIRNLGNKTKKKIGAKIIRAPFDRKKKFGCGFSSETSFFGRKAFLSIGLLAETRNAFDGCGWSDRKKIEVLQTLNYSTDS